MSFSKAKRFNYKDPDIHVSPADYYISTTLDKSCTISKVPRFQEKTECPMKYLCSRLNCSCQKYMGHNESDKRSSMYYSLTSSPKRISTPQRKTQSSINLNKLKLRTMHINRKNARNPFSMINKSNTPEHTNNVKHLIKKYENLPDTSEIFTSEEFIDDDYFSYASSDERHQFNRTKVYIDEKPHCSRNRCFEELILEKIDEISKNINKFQENLTDLQNKVNRTQNGQLHVEETEMNIFSSDGIKYIIFKSFEKLRDKIEFNHSVMEGFIDKLKNLVNDMYATNNSSLKEEKLACDITAKKLFKDIVDYLKSKDDLTCESPNRYELQELIEADDEFNRTLNPQCDVFTLLSQCLEESQHELENLTKDKLNISVKCNITENEINTQTSCIEKLYEAIEELKNTC